MRKLNSLLVLSLFTLSVMVQPVFAQAGGPIYIVQPGDSLSLIASRFNVTLSELIGANPAIDPNILAQGQELVIPGLEGITGILETEVIGFGDSLRSLSRRTQVSDAQLQRLNRLVSPSELYVGVSLIVPFQEGQRGLTTRMSPVPGESLLEIAVVEDSDPWTLTTVNKLNGSWEALPGDILYSPRRTAMGMPQDCLLRFLVQASSRCPWFRGGRRCFASKRSQAFLSLAGSRICRFASHK
jgi:LysM repeat protein